jgi:aryl carrier-like protein
VPLISRAELVAADPAARMALLVASLQRQVARVLGYGTPDLLGPTQPLAELGLDSLMAIQLRNRIQTDIGVSVAVGTLLKGVTTDRLARDVLARLGEASDTLPRTPALAASKETPEQLLARLDELGDTEVDALLADLLPDEEVPS